MKEEGQLCNYCGKWLFGNVFHGNDNKVYCGHKHEVLNDNRQKVFKNYFERKYLIKWKGY